MKSIQIDKNDKILITSAKRKKGFKGFLCFLGEFVVICPVCFFEICLMFFRNLPHNR